MEGEKIWKMTMGRYFLAIGHLVMGLLKEAQNPVDKLLFALKELKGKQSAKTVAQTVQKGLQNVLLLFRMLQWLLILLQLLCRLPVLLFF